MLLGILPLARVTFDMDLARSMHGMIMDHLARSGYRTVGGKTLLTDTDSVINAYDKLIVHGIDTVLVLQLTFTDAEAVEHLSRNHEGRISIWAVSEPRTGGRLRLNSFCGLHLASHALSLDHRGFRWHYGQPDGLTGEGLKMLIEGPDFEPLVPHPVDNRTGRTATAPTGFRIGVLGQHPDGFATCRYNESELESAFGVRTVRMELHDVFDTARNLPSDAANSLAAEVATMDGHERLEADAVRKSLKLKLALDSIIATNDLDGIALRCWPETFTEYGAAACAGAALLGDRGIPCACECDVFGALSQLVLNEVTDSPSFLADVVDMDEKDNTGVLWHCGQAPLSMCGDGRQPGLTVHSNRRLPLLFEFPLRPGPVTLMRISQSYGEPKLIMTAGTMVDRPQPWSGTCGVIRFERDVSEILPDLLASGLEHHVAMAYGDHRQCLSSIAGDMNLPVLEL